MKEGQTPHTEAGLQPRVGNVIETKEHQLLLDKMLGQGTFADVFRAYSKGTTGAKMIAAKIMALRDLDERKYSPKELRRSSYDFLQEANMLQTLAGEPNILPFVFYEQRQLSREQEALVGLESIPIIGTMIANGGTLFDQLKMQSIPEKVASMIDMTEGLIAAHEKGIVHGDIKAANVLCHVFDHTQGEVRLLSDWGTAMYEGDDPGEFIHGAIALMAPERAQFRVQRTSDVYTLGGVAYTMLTHQWPYQLDLDDRDAWLNAHATKAFTPMMDLPHVHPDIRLFEDLITETTRKDPNDRPTMREVKDELILISEKLSDDHYRYRRGERITRRLEPPPTTYTSRH